MRYTEEKDRKAEKHIYNIFLASKTPMTFYDIRDLITENSPFKDPHYINSSLKSLQEKDAIMSKKTVIDYNGKLEVVNEYCLKEGALNILEARSRKIGRDLLDGFKKLMGEKAEEFRFPITQRYPPERFDADLAIFTLKRQEYPDYGESGWKIDYEEGKLAKGIRNYKGGDVEVEFEVLNSRFLQGEMYKGDFDEVTVAGNFKRPLWDVALRIPQEAWEKYVKTIFNSIIPEIHLRTEQLIYYTNMIWFKSDENKENSIEVLEELEKPLNNEEITKFKDLVLTLARDNGSPFHKLNFDRKDDRQRYSEFLSYMKNRIEKMRKPRQNK